MRCFTVQERKVIGFNVSIYEGLACIKIGTTGELHYFPLSEHFQKTLSSLPLEAQGLMLNSSLEWTEVNEEDELDLVPKCDRNRKRVAPALVHVATEPLGGLQYASGELNQDVQDDGVIDHYPPFPSPGIEVLAIGGEENHMLLRMLPRAGFRILRLGARDKRWQRARVTWTGTDLLVHPAMRRVKAA